MSLWINHSLAERKVMLQQATEQKHLPQQIAVEKDWWVTAVLHALFTSKYAPYLLFKGGTSLSKGWNLIERFSEDIDLLINREYFLEEQKLEFAKCSNNNQIKFLRKAARDFITTDFANELKKQLNAMGVEGWTLVPITEKPDGTPIDHDSDPTVLELQYSSILEESNPYLPPVVKIEVSCLGMEEPFEVKQITSIIEECFVNEDTETSTDVATILPSRTFLEKAFLLNEEFQRSNPRSFRMSRHLYDLERIMDTQFAIDAFNDNILYDAVIAHRAKFYHVSKVNYASNHKDCVNFIPEGDIETAYRDDYKAMLGSFIYSQSALSYDQLLERLKILRERFRGK